MRRDLALWTELVRREGVSMPAEVPQLVGVTELLRDNIQAVEARLAQLVPLEQGADFPALWGELTQVFDMARGRDLRELINGAIAHQRAAVPVARAATERGLDVLRAQAIGMALITLAVAVVMYLIYATGLIKVTNTFRKVIIGATLGVVVFYGISILLSLFGMDIGYFDSASGWSIVLSIVIAGIAAFNLMLDFDLVDRGADAGAPKYMEWYAAFGLLVTLVWLYLEVLRLLAKLRQ